MWTPHHRHMRIRGLLVLLAMAIVVALLIGLPAVVGSSSAPKAGVIEVESVSGPERRQRGHADQDRRRGGERAGGLQRDDRGGEPSRGGDASAASAPAAPRPAQPPVPTGGGDCDSDDDAYDDDGYDEMYDDGAFDDDDDAGAEENDRSGDREDDADEGDD